MNRPSAGSNKHRQWQHRRQGARGISLLETLIAMALGLMVLTGVLQFVTQLVEVNTSTLKVARLEQDLRTLMDTMLQDIRRAGHFPEAVADLGNPARFTQNQPAAPTIDGAAWVAGQPGTAIGYAYRESDGKLMSGRFTYDAKAATILMHTGTASAPETITDPAFMSIGELSFMPELALVQAGNSTVAIPSVRIRIVARLKSDPAIERSLEDRITWRNPVVLP